MVLWYRANIGTGNGLLPDSTKAITWTYMDLSSMGFYAILTMVILMGLCKKNVTPVR